MSETTEQAGGTVEDVTPEPVGEFGAGCCEQCLPWGTCPACGRSADPALVVSPAMLDRLEAVAGLGYPVRMDQREVRALVARIRQDGERIRTLEAALRETDRLVVLHHGRTCVADETGTCVVCAANDGMRRFTENAALLPPSA